MNRRTAVEAYRRKDRPRAMKELRHFGRMPDFATALHDAARAIRPDGKTYDHQHRPGMVNLIMFHRALLPVADDLERAASFADLYDRIHAVAADCHMIGDLTVYDTALRVGAFLGLAPECVTCTRAPERAPKPWAWRHGASRYR